MNKPPLPLYQRVQLFSGGGSRFGYYLGSYAALCEQGLKPDLILATCGGSLAAMLINIAPAPTPLKQLLLSRECYDVINALRAIETQPKTSSRVLSKLTSSLLPPRYFYNALQRWRLSQSSTTLIKRQNKQTHAAQLLELQQLAMFQIDNEERWLSKLLSLKQDRLTQETLKQSNTVQAPDIAIVASRLCTSNTLSSSSTNSKATKDSNASQSCLYNAGLNSNPAKLQEVVFAPQKVIDCIKIHQDSSSSLMCPTYAYAPHRLLPHLATANLTKYGIHQAVRASMADMYYLAPTYITELGWCLGGVIDLTPIELACQLGLSVFAETKANYDTRLAVPAIKKVFGFDANVRLEAVHQFSGLTDKQIQWLPFADNGKALAGQHVRKSFNIRQGKVELIHANYAGFVTQMQAQWQYGYERTMDYLESSTLS